MKERRFGSTRQRNQTVHGSGQLHDDLRSINIQETAKRFKRAYGDHSLTHRLMDVRHSTELRALTDHRDALTHRGTLPRHHDLGRVPFGSVVDMGSAKKVTVPSNPKDVPASWKTTLVLGPTMTAEPRFWLGGTLNTLMREAGEFFEPRAAAAARAPSP